MEAGTRTGKRPRWCESVSEAENSASAPASAPDAELLTDAQVDALADVLIIERQRARNERAAEIAKLREEIADCAAT